MDPVSTISTSLSKLGFVIWGRDRRLPYTLSAQWLRTKESRVVGIDSRAVYVCFVREIVRKGSV